MSRPRKISLEDKPKHEHIFQSVEDKNGWVCIGLVDRDGQKNVACGVVRLTPQEFNYRAQAWNRYYEDVKKTESYALYQVMRGAIKDNNKTLISETVLRIRQLKEAGKNELTKPPFKDCVYELHSGRLVIKSGVVEINKEGQ